MSVTYEEFEKKAKDSGSNDQTGLTPGDYQSEYTGQMKETAEKMKNYGDFKYDKKKPTYQNQYKGQADKILDQMKNYGEFQYDGEKPVYQDLYRQELSELLRRVQNYGVFTYDTESDPSYASYVKQYRREGERAGQQALAQAASMTGGQLSSAAMTAVSQAEDYYASQLTDKIPELVDAAYGRYLDGYNILSDQLDQTWKAQQTAYSQYLNELNQYNTDRAQSYSEWLDGYKMLEANLGAVQSQEQTAYNQYLNELSQYNTDRAQSYSEWLDGYKMLAENLGAVQSQEQMAYKQYLDELSQYNTDRAQSYSEWLNGYKMLQDNFGVMSELDKRAYDRLLDRVGYNTQQAETKWQQTWKKLQANDEERQKQQALAQAQVDKLLSIGAKPDDDLIANSGYSPQYVKSMYAYYKSL